MSEKKAQTNGNGVDFPIVAAWAVFVFILYKAWLAYGRPWVDRTFESLQGSKMDNIGLGMDKVDLTALLIIMVPLLLAVIAIRRAAKRRKARKSVRNG